MVGLKPHTKKKKILGMVIWWGLKHGIHIFCSDGGRGSTEVYKYCSCYQWQNPYINNGMVRVDLVEDFDK